MTQIVRKSNLVQVLHGCHEPQMHSIVMNIVIYVTKVKWSPYAVLLMYPWLCSFYKLLYRRGRVCDPYFSLSFL
jgi:hypothetical protein